MVSLLLGRFILLDLFDMTRSAWKTKKLRGIHKHKDRHTDTQQGDLISLRYCGEYMENRQADTHRVVKLI
jgi:hypothetical protein